MPVVLGPNRYGKAEIRLVRVVRDSATHSLRDLNVSVALSGDLAQSHLTGDNTGLLPTDTQKNTVYAFAAEHGVGEIEAFGLRLARHFVGTVASVRAARVSVEEFGWRRLGPHSFQRDGSETRTAVVTATGDKEHVVSGVRDLVLMNTTDSEFHGFLKDRYTTLPETTDRILATAVSAQWRHVRAEGEWGKSYVDTRDALVQAFAGTYSYALQQTLYAMGAAVLERRPELAEVRLSLPNRHHFLVDLSPFDLANDGAVYHADDRPYGLIEGTVLRDDVSAEEDAWTF